MTHADFVAWHQHMGYASWEAGASALGVSRSTYVNLYTGTSRTTGKPMEYDRRTALACQALSMGLAGWQASDYEGGEGLGASARIEAPTHP